MTSASFSIIYNDILVEKYALVFTSIGGAIGMALGLTYIAPELPANWSKMLFVRSILLASFNSLLLLFPNTLL